MSAGVFAGRMPAPAHEVHRLGAIVCGPLTPPSWGGAAGPAGFFDLKGVLEVLAEALGAGVTLAPGERPFLHPGRSAEIAVGGEPAGWLGELHPRVAARWDLPAAAGFELDLAPLVVHSVAGEESYEDVVTFPALRQDLAVVVADEVLAEDVIAATLEAGGELLRGAAVFDLYRGEQVGDGRKSLALRLEFRASDRTLTDAEVAPVREAIEQALAQRVHAELRG